MKFMYKNARCSYTRTKTSFSNMSIKSRSTGSVDYVFQKHRLTVTEKNYSWYTCMCFCNSLPYKFIIMNNLIIYVHQWRLAGNFGEFGI